MPHIHGGMWGSEHELRSVFSWFTKQGWAPKFGSRPIGWYQQDMVGAIETLERIYRASKPPGASPDFHVMVRKIKGTKTVIAQPDNIPDLVLLGPKWQVDEIMRRAAR